MAGKLRYFFATGVIMLGMLSLFGLGGCSGEKYRVDYGGQETCYSNAREYYRAGQQVTLYFDLIATDTDYAFFLDDERIPYSYDEKKGFVIEFTMPDHDVKLECQAKNSMYAYGYDSP